jgi:hypothetical protein
MAGIPAVVYVADNRIALGVLAIIIGYAPGIVPWSWHVCTKWSGITPRARTSPGRAAISFSPAAWRSLRMLLGFVQCPQQEPSFAVHGCCLPDGGFLEGSTVVATVESGLQNRDGKVCYARLGNLNDH